VTCLNGEDGCSCGQVVLKEILDGRNIWKYNNAYLGSDKLGSASVGGGSNGLKERSCAYKASRVGKTAVNNTLEDVGRRVEEKNTYNSYVQAAVGVIPAASSAPERNSTWLVSCAEI